MVSKPPVDPLIARSNSVIQQMFSPLFAQLGQQRAAAEANTRNAYNAHASALEAALAARSGAVSQPFDTAVASAAAINDAVANRLNNVGSAQSNDLRAKLARISADPGAAAQLAQNYTGAANAGFARDAAALQHLVGRRGEAVSYANKLPGLGRLSASNDYASALNQLRSNFASREAGLQEDVARGAMSLYDTFRQENQAERQMREQARQAELDRRQEDKQALMALRAAALDKATERAYDQQIRNMERQWELEDQQWEAQQDAIDRASGGSDAKLTGPANQKWITVNGQIVKNPNYVPPTKAKPKGSTNDTWQTVGSAKRERVINTIRNKIINPDFGRIRDQIVNSPTPDRMISNMIWREMRLLGIPPTSAAGKKLWRDIFLSLENVPSSKGPYQLPQFVKRTPAKPKKPPGGR